MEFASMEANLKIVNVCVNVCVFLWLFIWVLVDIFKQKSGEITRFHIKFSSSCMITIIPTSVITISHMGLIIYKFLMHEVVTCESVIMALTWCLASTVTVYSMKFKTFDQITKWPTVLVIFWCYSVILESVLVTLIMLDYVKSKKMEVFRSASSVINIATLPFFMIWCYNGVTFCGIEKHKESEEPLLQGSVGDTSAFTNAGIWKRVTFNWLNTLFESGWAEKLEFSHVPSIPESETSEEAALLLEESIYKQKAGGSVLTKAIFHAVRRSLAINAVFAEMFFKSARSVVYVTHQLEFLSASDLVLVINDGEIVQSGKYNDLIADPASEFARQIVAHSNSLNQVSLPDEPKHVTKFQQASHGTYLVREHESSTTKSGSQEESQSGRVRFNVYSTFITSAYKGALVPVIIIYHALFLAFQMGSNYWMAWATEDEGRVSSKELIVVFMLLSGARSVFILGRAVSLSTVALETGQNLFLQMIASVFRAPVSFFDSTPSSRILNRVSNLSLFLHFP